MKDLLNFLNNCAIVKICKNARQIVNLPQESYSRIEQVVSNCDGHKLLRVTEILSEAESDMRYSLNGRITLETAVLKCAMPSSDYNLDALIGKISALEKKLSEKTVTVVKEVPVVQKKEETKPVTKIAEDSPFAEEPKEKVQTSILDNTAPSLNSVRMLNENEKSGIFAKLIRLLRTTRKNAVLFTLCMDVGNFFEGDKMILTTDSEAVFKGLQRVDNANFLSETLLELGVGEHEVRLVKKGESEYDKAVRELKQNFDGIDIEIK